MAADLLARVRAEIDSRLQQLRPAVDEYKQLLDAFDAFDTQDRAARPTTTTARTTAAKAPAAKAPAARAGKTKAEPAGARAAKAPGARSSATEQAIVAALEHGSHTVGELGMVTAISGSEIRTGLGRLQRAGTVVRTKREGRAAYALSSRA